MRIIERYIAKNWFLIAAGLIFTELAVRAAYEERECIRFGGEWLVLPMILMLAETVRNTGAAIRFLFTGGDEDGKD